MTDKMHNTPWLDCTYDGFMNHEELERLDKNSYHKDKDEVLQEYLDSMYPDTPDGPDAPPIVALDEDV